MKLIKPIQIISKEEHKDILLNDLQKVFKKVSFDKNSYKLSDFEFKVPVHEDKILIGTIKSSVAVCVWEKSSIYFSEEYFDLNESVRIAYFFHEICHFVIYSTNEQSEKIVLEGNKIKDAYVDEAAKNNVIINQNLISKNNHKYLLNLFNEQLTDNEMIKLNEDLFKIKLKSNISSNFNKFKEDDYFFNLFILLIDCIRSTELIKNKKDYSKELKRLLEFSKQPIKALKDNCEKERYEVYMNYKDKLLERYESEDAILTIGVFNELIETLIKI